jgi:hypothetical protein
LHVNLGSDTSNKHLETQQRTSNSKIEITRDRKQIEKTRERKNRQDHTGNGGIGEQKRERQKKKALEDTREMII